MAVNVSVSLSQLHNPEFDSGRAENETDNAKLCYRVDKAVNTLYVKVGQKLNPAEVYNLISGKFNVTITEPKL